MNTKSWLLIVSMMLMVACHKGGNAQVANIPMVKIDTVGTTTGESTLQFPGKVVASQQVNASFRVAGTLKRVCVEEGSRVKAGQLLAEMDATDYKVQLEATEAEYAQVKAEAELKVVWYDGGLMPPRPVEQQFRTDFLPKHRWRQQ